LSRYRKDDWLELGARLLASEGAAALTLERLTAAAGRTRGSFYHHFADRDAFLMALMDRWRNEVLVVDGRRYEEAQTPAEVKKLMREQYLRMDHAFERAARRFAANEPIVRAAVDEIDRARMEGGACVLSHLRPELDDPQAAAIVQYATLVGLQWLVADPADPRIPAIRKYGDKLFQLEDEDGG